MTVQIMQTAALVCFLSIFVINAHRGLGHDPAFWVKAVEVIVMIISGIVFIVACFFWVWR